MLAIWEVCEILTGAVEEMTLSDMVLVVAAVEFPLAELLTIEPPEKEFSTVTLVLK